MAAEYWGKLAAEYLGKPVVRMGAARKRAIMKSNGLTRRAIDLPDGTTTIFCWVPKELAQATAATTTCISENGKQKGKPTLVLLHGFGSNGTDAWAPHVPALAKHFALFIPDLLFFGDSVTRSPVSRSEIFQANCIQSALLTLSISRTFVAGHSYGGFVAYRLAHLFPTLVSKLIIIASGIRMDSHSNDAALQKTGASSIHDILAPNSLPAFKQTLELVFNKPPRIPDYVLRILLKNPNRARHLELINAIELGKDDVPSELPKVAQKTLIIWGDKDQIFDIKLAHALEEYLEGNAQLKIYKGAGHVPQLARSFNEDVISFLITTSHVSTNVPPSLF